MAGKMKALQMWCKNNTVGYKDVNVVNMTTSWRDGLAFCALIHHFRPDLIDFNSLSKENVLHNNQLAFRTAEEELGIAALLDAEDMVAMKVPDKLSIITYVSQYYNCLHSMKPAEDKALKRSSSPTNTPDLVEAKRKSTPESTESKVPISPTPVLVEKKQIFSVCEICKKKVHLVERYVDEGKIYHRQCHRTKSLSGMYQRNRSSPFHDETNDNTGKNPFKAPEKLIVDKPTVSPNSSSKKTAKESPKPPSPMINVSTVHKPTTSPNNSPKKKANESPKRASRVLDMALSYDETTKFDSKEAHSSTGNKVVVSNTRQNTANAASTARNKNESKSAKQDTVPTDVTTSSHVVSPKPSQASHKSEDANQLSKKPSEQHKTGAEFADGIQDKSHTVSSTSKSEIGAKHQSFNENEKVSKDANKQMLPSLLKSLADVKQTRVVSSSEQSSTGGKDDSQLPAISPLISEIPKPPQAKPRSRASSSNEPSEDKPKTRPRSNNSSFGSEANHSQFSETNVSTGDSNCSLKPFAASSESTSTKTTPSLDGRADSKLNADAKELHANNSTNLSGDELVEKQCVATTGLNSSPKKKTLAETGDVKMDQKQDVPVKVDNDAKLESKSVESRTMTINTVSADDARLNPFTDEYEDKKKTVHTPLPPTRKKNQGASVKTHDVKSLTNPSPTKTPTSSPLSEPKSHVPVRPKLPNLSESNSPHPSAKVAKQEPALSTHAKQNTSKVAENKGKEMVQLAKKQVKKTQDTAVRVQSSMPQNNTTIIKSPTQQVKSPVQKQFFKPSRPAPGFGFPLVKRRVKNQMTEDEIMNEMTILDIQLKDLEKKGVKLEEVLRDEMDLGAELKSESDQLLGDWFDLVQEKNVLVRRETDLVFLMQQQRLEQQHADVEFKIRKLLNKPDVNKSDKEKEEESKLLAQLMDIVERRNTIITSIEEARVKEEEEDAAYDRMKMLQTDSHNDSEVMKKKKKNKVKRIFSKRKKPPKSPKGDLPTSPST